MPPRLPGSKSDAGPKSTPSKVARKVAKAIGASEDLDTKTGVETRDSALDPTWAKSGDVLTGPGGVPIPDTDNSLKAGLRGPTLMEDFHLREKIMHFDHERIPERVVHARGAAAHGVFKPYKSHSSLTSAHFLSDPDIETPVFVRFSTVAGSRGSMDTARDVRGFAVKFYTQQGNFDLVGNNIPVFFIQDGIKFPDVIHAAKPHPDREIPQAQTAHDTFWDFVSLTTESAHMLMWVMSDRAIPRSYRTMEGFGVHTFRLVNAKGKTALVKFHWKPLAGVHSLVWEECLQLGGADPDFHRRDLWDAIEDGAYPEWELGVQIMPDGDEMFGDIDLLDPTKIVPEEQVPVIPLGKLTLNRNPSNYFAETEQVAFHTGHLVPGINVTDDPLMQARLFSYLDTQLTRLGGPNFEQIPINRPVAPVNDNQRDGFHQQAIHTGITTYSPNGLSGGCPYGAGKAGYTVAPAPTQGSKVRDRAPSFKDHYTQATMFWNSMSQVEKDHIVRAFSFELSKCESQDVQTRVLGVLANIDGVLCKRVSAHLGLPVPKPGRGRPSRDAGESPALSQLPKAPGPIKGRVVGIIASDGVDAKGLGVISNALTAAGAKPQIVAPHGGTLKSDAGVPVPVNKTLLGSDSVEFDAIVLAGGSGVSALQNDPAVRKFVQDSFHYFKPIAAWGEGREVLDELGISSGQQGVATTKKANSAFGSSLVEMIGWHRFWDRQTVIVDTNP